MSPARPLSAAPAAQVSSVLICEDHVMMREALAGMLELMWPDAVIEVAPDYPSAIAAMARRPSICLSDLSMPGAAPLEGMRDLRAASPGTPILVITGNEHDALLARILGLGVAGVVPKTANPAVVEAAIRIVSAGERYIPPRLYELHAQNAVNETPISVPPAGVLTPRQADVVRLIAAGQSNKEIARTLDLSIATVKAHAAASFMALGARNRVEAVERAVRLGLISRRPEDRA